MVGEDPEGGAVCVRVPGSTHLDNLVRVQSRRLGRFPKPGASAGLIPRRCQGPSPSAVSARLLWDHKPVTWELHWRRTPDVNEDARPKLPARGTATPTVLEPRGQAPRALIRTASTFWPRTPART